jgi:glycolate oxidase iron-sulfur subunit
LRRLAGRLLRRLRGIRVLSTPVSRDPPRLTGGAAGRIGLLPGCGLDLVAPDLVAQAGRVLMAAGYEVVELQGVCCGALHAHQGRGGAAARRATALQAKAAAFGVERLLTLNPVCAAAMRDANPGCPADELCSFLVDAQALSELEFRPLPVPVAVHLPCTQESLGWRGDALAVLLARIPGLQPLPLETPHGCCGAAGLHGVLHPSAAAVLRTPLAARADAATVEYLVSSNPGCAQHIAAGCRSARPRIAHPVALLAQQLSTEPKREQPS